MKRFSNRDLLRLMIPLMIDQVLLSAAGMVDTVMVSNVGAAAVSGVALVDSVNAIVIYFFSAMATGGTIICSQYLGRQDQQGAKGAADQVVFSVLVLSAAVTLFCILLRRPLLALIFGQVEEGVMDSALTYMLITALSFPFIAFYNVGAALYRAQGNSRLPLLVSSLTNLVNIGGNALFLFVLDLGVAGAALSTLISRFLSGMILLFLIRRPHQTIVVDKFRDIRPDLKIVLLVMSVGLPTGLENGMFQFGKLAVQSTVSTLGTAAIAAQAIMTVLEALSSMPSTGIGLGMMTVVGQCMGAGEAKDARGYIYKLSLWSEAALAAAVTLVWLAVRPVTILAGMTAESAGLAWRLMTLVSLAKVFLWMPAFTPANGLRAAGDVKYPMAVSIASMWIFRVGLCMLLCRRLGFGLEGVWIAWVADWGCRGVCNTVRLLRGKWMTMHILKD